MIKENQILIELLNGVDRWCDLKIKLEEFNTAQTESTTKKTQAGKIFEVFTKYYLQTDPKKTELYKNVWLYDEISIEIKEKLRLPSIDHGIDILLQDYDNNFHAVQCKFKNDETKSLSWSGDKIANVFALGTNCHRIIVFTNASDTTSVAKAFEEKFEQIAVDELNSIEPEILKGIYDLARGNQPKALTKHKPKEHQIIAIEKVVQHFESNNRGQLILPCGAGKTVTALWIKEKIKSKITLVLVPSLALLKQIKNDWARHKSYSYSYLCVCSEKDIDNDQEDAVRLHTYEIGGPVTTNPEEVKLFLSKSGDKIIYSTYQSIEVIIKAVKSIHNFSFDLVICDEAHRTAGSKEKNSYTLVHFDKNLPALKRLYMTATPKIVSKKLKRKLGEDYELICDMSNPEIYGEEAYHMTFGEAIDKEILVDYKIIGIGVTDRQIQQQIEERRYLGEYTADELANNFALELVMSNYGAYHSISFHSRVEYARNFAKRHNDFYGDVFSKSVDGDQTTTLRSKILNEFRDSPKGLVANARCLTEGVDVPSIDLIYFCDPKSSVVDIVQASGRALRLDPTGKKKCGYIVVPIFHHEDQDVETEIKKKPIFEHLIQVIRSLCDHDERLRSEMNEIALCKGKRENSRINLDFSGSKIENIIKLEGIEEKVRKVLFDEIIEKTSSNWELRFHLMKEYIEKNGHSTISKNDKNNSELYYWAANLRKNYYEGRLESSKLKRLNEINFDWKGENRREITDLDEIWRQNYSKLEDYFNKNGNSDVPARYKDKALGTWAVTQRVKRNDNKLEAWQVEQLNKLSFNWKPKNKFEDFVEALKQFIADNGHTKILQSETGYGKLPDWVNDYRVIYNNGVINKKGDIIYKVGKLTKLQIETLDDLGFLWSAGNLDWEKRYQDLKDYFLINGHTNVRGIEDKTLYNWSHKQKKNKNKLTENQTKLLNEINFNFGYFPKNEKQWFEKLDELNDYYVNHGDLNIPKNSPDYLSLLRWLRKQRKNYLSGLLSNEKFNLIKEIGFDINYFLKDISNDETLLEESKNENKETWDSLYLQLINYKMEHGNCNVPRGFNANKFLPKFVSRHRENYKNGTLEDAYIKKLELIGFEWEVDYKQKYMNIWLERYSELVKVYNKNKTSSITKSSVSENLYSWMLLQRMKYRKNELTDKQIELLNDIKFDWNPESPVGSPDDDIWFVFLEQLAEYRTKFGNCNVSQLDVTYKKLGRWVNDQRLKFSRGKLLEHRKDLLEDLGIIWNIKEHEWQLRLNSLKSYYEKYGHFDVKQSDNDFSGLYDWLYKMNRKGTTKERINKLSEIGFDTKNIINQTD